MREIRCCYSACMTDGDERERVQYGLELAERIMGEPEQEWKVCAYDLIFSGGRSIASRTRRRKEQSDREYRQSCAATLVREAARVSPFYIKPVKKQDNGLLFQPVERLILSFDQAPASFERKQLARNTSFARRPISGYTEKKLSKRFSAVKLRLVSDMLQASVRDRLFIARFNQEQFLKGLAIEDKPLFTALSALYSITFFGLSLKDVYLVDSIFSDSGQQGREKDMMKTRSARELFEIMSGEPAVQAQTFDKMSRALVQMPLPAADFEKIELLAENYTCYAGVANMSAAYIKALKENSALAEALEEVQQEDFSDICEEVRRLSQFSAVVSLCDDLAAWKFRKSVFFGAPRLSRLQSYHAA